MSGSLGTVRDDEAFCRALPKLECHAHLNGSIPDSTLKALIDLKRRTAGDSVDPEVLNFRPPDTLTAIEEFFPIFSKTVYRLTDTHEAVAVAARGVIEAFRDDGCMYLELRTTLRKDASSGMTYKSYLETVLSVLHSFEEQESKHESQRRMIVRLIVSVNWTHPKDEVDEIIDLAIEHARKGGVGYVVAVDVCGDPSRSEPDPLRAAFAKAKAAGLRLTVHFGEIVAQLPLLDSHLGLQPDRLGHATFLTPEVKQSIIGHRTPIEICITSNVLCKTVPSIKDHHIVWALQNDVPILICTDDMLIFRNSPSFEYATALSLLPGGRQQLVDVVRRGVDATFASEDDKNWMRQRLASFTV